jgi:hypothetical protein
MTTTRVHIEAIQYTEDREPVLVQYRGTDVTRGPLSASNTWHPTQSELVALMAPELRASAGDRWGRPELHAGLRAFLIECGYADPEITANVDPAQPEEPVQATRLEAAESGVT